MYPVAASNIDVAMAYYWVDIETSYEYLFHVKHKPQVFSGCW